MPLATLIQQAWNLSPLVDPVGLPKSMADQSLSVVASLEDFGQASMQPQSLAKGSDEIGARQVISVFGHEKSSLKS